MRAEAAEAGRYSSKLWHDKDYPRIQILTIEGLLNWHRAHRCPSAAKSFRHGRTGSRGGAQANGDVVNNATMGLNK